MAQTIYESNTTVVARGSWHDQTVVTKTLRQNAQTPGAIARYQREFNLNQSLTSPHVCQALAYDERNCQIVFEDDRGISLRELLAREPINFDEKIAIAAELAKALQSIHDEGVIHRDLNPANILIIGHEKWLDDHPRIAVKLIDFGLATLASHELPSPERASLTGTLPYISPEQTGRLNRVVDYRTDLYSLGATLYELFAGHPPFGHTDPLELIHAHIASEPQPLGEAVADVPGWLSDLVGKLLAKQPESRYQSARSVYDDLIEALNMANVTQFRLAQTDSNEQLVIPRKLYGRTQAQQALSDLLERSRHGESLFAAIGGEPGMGKSALCEGMLREAADSTSLTASVDCGAIDLQDEFSVWVELIRHLLRQLLSSTDAQGESILQGLRNNGSTHLTALARVIPELSALADMDNPSHGSISQGISVVLDLIKPASLTLVVENAHLASTDSIRSITEKCIEHRSVLALISWEDVDRAIFAEPRVHARTTFINLKPLNRADVREMLGDMFSHSEARVRELAAQVQTKTDGVPALVLELVFELHRAGHIFYDRAKGEWAWQIDEIKRFFFNTNAVERIDLLLDALPPETREPLCAGACIGERFDLELVARILAEPPATVAKLLRPTISEGIAALTPEHSYQFAHARVRAAVYERMPDAVKRTMHLRAAEVLRHGQPEPTGDSAALQIAQHLNAATNPVDTTQELRQQVAHYNLLAARECVRQHNFQLAYKFARTGLTMLGDAADQSALRLELTECAAEAAYLCGDFDQLNRFHAARHDTSALSETHIRSAMVRNQLTEATELAHTALQRLSIRPSAAQFSPFTRTLRRLLHQSGLARWTYPAQRLPKQLQESHDITFRQTARLSGFLAHAAFHLGAPALASLSWKILRAAQDKGYSGEIAFAFAIAAVTALANNAPYVAQTYARHARTIARQFSDDAFSVRAVTTVSSLVDPWFGNFDQTVRSLVDTSNHAMALQDYEFAAAAGAFYATNGLVRGLELNSMKRAIAEHIALVNRHGHITGVNIQYFVSRIVASLLGLPDDDTQIHEAARSITNREDRFAQGCVYTLRLYYAVLFNDFAGAQTVAELARGFQHDIRVTPLHCLYLLCSGLVATRRSQPDLAVLRRRIKALARQMSLGAEFAGPKLQILQGELAKLQGKTNLAFEHWESAAHIARRCGIANDEALAYELAARAAQQAGRTDFAELFSKNAHRAYMRWGATAKAAQLERDLPGLGPAARTEAANAAALNISDLADLTLRDFDTNHGSLQSAEFNDRVLDTATALRAAQTISSEIVLDRVITKLLRLALEHAGAQKACMVLRNEGRFYLEAIASVDRGTTRRLSPAEPIEATDDLPVSVAQFVARTSKSLVLSDATQEDVFTHDPYIQRMQPLSVLCLPIVHRNELTGMLYVEHRWLTGVFTAQRVETLTLLASQAAISIENARLYADLQAARDEYQTLYDSAIEGLFRISSDGQLLGANPTLAKILQFDSTQDLLQDYRDLIQSVFLKTESAQQFLSMLEENSQVTGFEAQGITRSGKVFWMSLTARITHDPEAGEYIDGSLFDISERIERAQADQQRQIAEAASIAKSEFLANMSHEIRTPMNAIVGFTKLALETELSRKQHEYLTSIRNAGENLLTLVSDILDFSKIEAGKLTLEEQPFRLRDTLSEVERLFRTDIRRKRLSFHLEDHTHDHDGFPINGILFGDSLRLQQVLVNLIGNAIKFTNSGAITLSVALDQVSGDVLTLRFSVSDTGIGISAEQIERLFESFEQAESSTTRRFGGTGLGLTICKRLVHIMGGEISVQSEPGEGSTFSFTTACRVPNDADMAHEEAPPARFNAQHLLRGKWILVAEDNPINQQLALEFLQRAGANVDIAETGRQAIAAAVDKNYDAILMDIHMPQLDGFEATRTLREHGLDLPIIAVSADALSERRTAALDAGCDAYVTKPIDFDILLSELARFLPANAAPLPTGRRATDSPELVADNAEYANALNLQRVAGIDIGAAIRSHNGNVQLMIKLMGDFGKYYADAGAKIREQISAQQYEEAERLAHNLHGVAGSFGAERLREASKTLELALAKGDTTNLYGLAQSFEIALAEVLESAEALASREIRFRESDFSSADSGG